MWGSLLEFCEAQCSFSVLSCLSGHGITAPDGWSELGILPTELFNKTKTNLQLSFPSVKDVKHLVAK
jgi:hypothetical protein